jgi:type II secretory pathway component PulF
MTAFTLALLTRRLSDMVQSGLPLNRSLYLLAQQGGRSQSAVLADLLGHIQSGRSLSDAMAERAEVFPPMYVGLIRAGEAAGSLDAVLAELSGWLEKDAELRQRLTTSLVYPAFLLLLVASVGVFLVSFVIPRFEPLFQELGQALPWPTRVLMAIAHGFGPVAIAAGIAASAGALVLWTRRQRLQEAASSVLLRLGRLSGPLKSLYLERWAFAMSLLLRNGLTVPEALTLSRSSLGSHVFAGELDAVLAQVREGLSLGEAMAASKLFPASLREMVAAGEETAGLETILTRAAAGFHKESELQRRVLMALLEPSLVVGMGCVVGFVALSMLLPLLQLNGNVQ